MKIKITPETDAEKKKFKPVEHTDVNEFFIFGNKADGDDSTIDFHDWSGGRRYLIYNLEYFKSVVLAEEREIQALNKTASETEFKPKMMKYGAPKEQNTEVIQFPGTPTAGTGDAEWGEKRDLDAVIDADVIPPKPVPPPNELIREDQETPF